MKINLILNLMRKTVEEMPLAKTAEMFVYKLVKDERCREYEIVGLILYLRRIGLCQDEFYVDKLAELIPNNRTEVIDLYDDILCDLTCPKEGDNNAGTT